MSTTGGSGTFFHNEWFLFAPVLFFTLYFNLFYRAQIGIRFFLVVTPLLLVFCGSLLRGWRGFGRERWGLVATLSLYLVASVLSYFPHYIPYFNELVPDRRFAYKILADSNLDWGQDGWYVQQYLASHPQTHVDPERPTAGEILISANNLVGITAKPDTYRWLRDHFQPVGTVGYAYLIFEVPPGAAGE